jgi:hypothetical protein
VSVTRQVTRAATVPLEGNAYPVDQALVGRWVALRYEPEDLSRVDVLPGHIRADAATSFVTRRSGFQGITESLRAAVAWFSY